MDHQCFQCWQLVVNYGFTWWNASTIEASCILTIHDMNLLQARGWFVFRDVKFALHLQFPTGRDWMTGFHACVVPKPLYIRKEQPLRILRTCFQLTYGFYALIPRVRVQTIASSAICPVSLRQRRMWESFCKRGWSHWFTFLPLSAEVRLTRSSRCWVLAFVALVLGLPSGLSLNPRASCVRDRCCSWAPFAKQQRHGSVH